VKRITPLLLLVLAIIFFRSCGSTKVVEPAVPQPTIPSVASLTPSTTPEASPVATTTVPTPQVTDPVTTPESTAVQIAQALMERGRAASTGYSRDQFGSAWKDVDHNGCDTRNDILQRDFTTVVLASGNCKVIGGTWTDPYSNESYTFLEQPSGAQIDHVVALKNAWEMGADLWSADQRVQYANDPLNLVVTIASLNQQKSDSNAASWLPPYKPGRCNFIARQVAVKIKYQLYVTASEKVAMLKVLSTSECQDTILPK
jgi:hypothetical protein